MYEDRKEVARYLRSYIARNNAVTDPLFDFPTRIGMFNRLAELTNLDSPASGVSDEELKLILKFVSVLMAQDLVSSLETEIEQMELERNTDDEPEEDEE
jgi:hypothetical protein